jgi:hypothetical protein
MAIYGFVKPGASECSVALSWVLKFCVTKNVQNLKIKVYKTVILQVVRYGCETWSLTLGEEHRLRVFENSVEEDIWT